MMINYTDMDIRQSLLEKIPLLILPDFLITLWGLVLLLRIGIFVLLACLESVKSYKQIELKIQSVKSVQQQLDPTDKSLEQK